MIRNYFTIALRTFRKHKTFTFINLLGLSVGMACSILISLWVYDELQFNQVFDNSERIFKVMQNRQNEDGSIVTEGNTPYPLATVLAEEYPAVEQSVQVTDEEELSLSVGEIALKERSIFASPNVFEVFSCPFLVGDPTQALNDAQSIVISESLKQTLFGKEDALGKIINLNAGELIPFTVSGVFADMPYHSTLQFDVVLPIPAVLPFLYNYEHWGNSFLTTYLRLNNTANPSVVNEQIADVVREKGNLEQELFLLSLTDTYRYTTFENGKAGGGRIENIRLFGIIAILILLIACINFINLTTARATRRSKEVGVRKVAGASKMTLIRQFLSESVLMAMASLTVAVAIVAIVLPQFNQLTGKHIAPDYFHPSFIITLLSVGLICGFLSGVYPAFFLSSFRTINVLKGTVTTYRGTTRVRRSLVIFQFAVATLLMAGTLAVIFQMDYIRHKNLGLETENVIYAEMDMGTNLEAYQNDLSQEPGIQYATAANGSFNLGFGATSDLEWKGKPEGQLLQVAPIIADYDFIEALGIRIKKGRSFSRKYNDTIAYILNEEAVKVLGLEEPIGEEISMFKEPGPIVGIAENFHFAPLHETIEPMIIQLDPRKPGVLYVRSEAGKTKQALAALQKVHKKYSNYPLDYHFLDQTMEAMYQSDRLTSKLSSIFAGLAIFISCLGLLGLAIFTTEQRTKEIGIRKVLGASVSSLLFLLSKDHLKLLVIAYVIAIPVANYFISEWLRGFAYRIEISGWLFAVSGLLILLIALLSVSTQTVKAARRNPVDSLRDE